MSTQLTTAEIENFAQLLQDYDPAQTGHWFSLIEGRNL